MQRPFVIVCLVGAAAVSLVSTRWRCSASFSRSWHSFFLVCGPCSSCLRRGEVTLAAAGALGRQVERSPGWTAGVSCSLPTSVTSSQQSRSLSSAGRTGPKLQAGVFRCGLSPIAAGVPRLSPSAVEPGNCSVAAHGSVPRSALAAIVFGRTPTSGPPGQHGDGRGHSGGCVHGLGGFPFFPSPLGTARASSCWQ